MREATEEDATPLKTEAPAVVNPRIQALELQVERLRTEHELFICFLFLTVLHVLAFYKLLPMSLKSAWPTWIALSGIGTAAVWFAWTQRPVWESIVRVTIALALVALMTPDVVPHFMRFPAGQRAVTARFIGGFQYPIAANSVVRQDSFRSIVICWIVGAFVAAFLATWFLGIQFKVPCMPYKRRPMSIRSMLALTFCAALASFFIRSSNWVDRSLYFVNGMTLGFVAAGIAWGVFQKKIWQRFLYPLAVVGLIVALDLGVGGYLKVWKGSVLDRFEYVAIFVGGLSVSPVLSFALLRQYGFRLTSSRGVSNGQP